MTFGGFKGVIEGLVALLLVFWVSVSLYSAILGRSGYLALAGVERKVSDKAAAVNALRREREALERHADQLSFRSLDLDLADERIRTVLGYARPGDMVVPKSALERVRAAGSNP